jgi:cysteine-rich repeat protein
MKRRVMLAVGALTALVGSCREADSVLVVTVEADSGVSGVVQLRATLSNADKSSVNTFPENAGTASLAFPTKFSLTIAHSRAGNVDVALDGLGAGGVVVANGAGSATLSQGSTTQLTITLHAGASLCGNGVIDPGEQCDDGNRISEGVCDFMCRLPAGSDGGAGAGGAVGAGGVGGAAGVGGRAGAGGVAGTTGVAGTGGMAGTSGAAGSTAGAGGRGGNAGSGAAGTGGRGGAAGSTAGTGGSSAGTGGRGGTGGGSAGTGGGSGGTGGGPCTVQLLVNGNFDLGQTGWTSVSAAGRLLIYNSAIVDPTIVPAPRSAPDLAWLGYNVVSETDSISQTITIPAGAVSLTVSGYYIVNTNEDTATKYDTAAVDLIGGISHTALAISNQNQNTDWTLFTTTYPLTPSTTATTETYQISVTMDDGVITSFFFDDMSVTANFCQ